MSPSSDGEKTVADLLRERLDGTSRPPPPDLMPPVDPVDPGDPVKVTSQRRSKAPLVLGAGAVFLLILGIVLLTSKSEGETVSRALLSANRTSVEVVGQSVQLRSQIVNISTSGVKVDSIVVTEVSVSSMEFVFDGGDRVGIGTPLILTDVTVDGRASFSLIVSLRVDARTCALARPARALVRFTGSSGKHRRAELTLPDAGATIRDTPTLSKLCSRAALPAS